MKKSCILLVILLFSILLMVTVDWNLTRTANFVVSGYSLTVSSNASEGGAIVLNNTGPYFFGDVVKLTTVAEAGWKFIGWSDDLFGSSNPASIVIDSDKTVQALFVREQYSLTIQVVGEGVVESQGELFSDFGIQTNYSYGDVVLLDGFPSSGWHFEEWTGNFTNEGVHPTDSRSFSIIMLGNCSITATFVESDYTLTVEIIGHGTVSKSPDKATYHYGEEVILTATPLDGWSFYSWGGNLVGSFTNPEVIVMNKNNTITALFSEHANTTLSLLPETVSGPPPGLGEEFTLKLHIENAVDVWAWMIKVEWNPDVLTLVNVEEGDFLTNVGETLFLHPDISLMSPGVLEEVMSAMLSVDGPSGSGDLAFLTFRVVGYGSTQIEITNSKLEDNDLVDGNSFHFRVPHLMVGSAFELSPPPGHGVQ